jgi:predicted component of type VI protein secretion system
MEEIYYALPVRQVESGKLFQRVTMQDSVKQNIKLLLSTFPSQVPYAPLFGSVLNLYHHELPNELSKKGKLEEEIKDKVEKHLKKMMSLYEPRFTMTNLEVTPILRKQTGNQNSEGRISLEIRIKGKYLNNKEDQFQTTIPIR